MKECGECAMCCKLLPIPEPEIIAKDGNKWCKFWKKQTGCNIYSDRPEVCRRYFCAWIQDDNLPEELRPDRCGAVMHFKDGQLIVVVAEKDNEKKGFLKYLLDSYDEGYHVYYGATKLYSSPPNFFKQEMKNVIERKKSES